MGLKILNITLDTHVDLQPTGSARREVDRPHALGATTVQEHESHTVPAAPEGNEFCVTGSLK